MERRKDNKGRVLNKGESQRKDGTYVFQYSCGEKRKSIYAKTLNELRLKEKNIKAELEYGIVPVNKTLNQVFDNMMEVKRLKLTTKAAYLNKYGKYVRQSKLGKLNIKSIKRSNILLFCDTLLKSGVSAQNVTSIVGLLDSCFDFAIADDLIYKNPCIGVAKQFHTVKQTSKFSLTAEQAHVFLEYVKTNASRYYPLILTLLHTGMRVSEAIGLTWNDIDFDKKTINVNHQLINVKVTNKYEKHISTPKSSSGNRVIPMTAEVFEVFKNLKSQSYFVSQKITIDNFSGFCFLTQLNQPYNRQYIVSLLARIIEKYNSQPNKIFELPKISPHILRHTACTLMNEAGVDLKVMQYIMGHNNISVTMSVYTHVTDERSESEFLKLESLL